MKIFLFLLLLLTGNYAEGFQTPSTSELAPEKNAKDVFGILESGQGTRENLPPALYHLGRGEYEEALGAMDPHLAQAYPWLGGYLEGLVSVSAPLKKYETAHYDLYVPPDQEFLADYAMPVLETIYTTIERVLSNRPKSKIRVEIYPTLEAFSKASTLSMATLESSGAIGICKFHRLMIVSPNALPLGYRWMDALAHEYNHLTINELTDFNMELWLHEGIARYLDTLYRSDPPDYLSPNQKSTLKTALEENKLVSFKRMSPSLVYLKDQDEVNLAFCQVSHAASLLIDGTGRKKFQGFLANLRTSPFEVGFKKSYGKTTAEFEADWIEKLKNEKWDKVVGAMSDEVQFESKKEEDLVGASAQARIRLGDRMRTRGQFQAALIEYERGLEEEPDNGVLLLKAARTHRALGENEAAIVKLRRAVQKNPNYITPTIELSELAQAEEAFPLLKTALAINPFDPRIHKLLADIYTGRNEAGLAEKEIRIFNSLNHQ